MQLPIKLSKESAYISGVLAGDGSIYCREDKKEYVIKCVGNPYDEKTFYKNVIKPIFKNEFGITLNVKYQDSKTTYGFIVYSKELYLFFVKKIGHPTGKKYEKLRIPFAIRNVRWLEKWFIRGLFDTDGCITFKKRYKKYPYYPVIVLSSKSKKLVKDVAKILRDEGLILNTFYDYKVYDSRFKDGYSLINRIELNGSTNLRKWVEKIGFSNPKHLSKIKKYWEGNSEGWI